MDENQLNAVLSLFMAACLIPLFTVFFSLYLAGRKLTLPHVRTELGNWLGRFSFSVGVFLFCITGLVLDRWLDFNPDIEHQPLSTVLRVIGVGALIWSLVSAHYVFPLLLQRIREGRI